MEKSNHLIIKKKEYAMVVIVLNSGASRASNDTSVDRRKAIVSCNSVSSYES